MSAILFDPMLRLQAESVDDLENLRKAAENRLRQLTRNEEDSDGENRGFGLSKSNASVIAQQGIVDGIKALEKKAISDLEKSMKAHPLGSWIAGQKGVGNKTIARLLAAIEDPYWNNLHDRPRTVSELWAYCGLHVVNGVGAKRTKGTKINWNAEAKMRAWNIVDPIVKCRESPYRKLYDTIKAGYEGKTYDERYEGRMFLGKPIVVGQPLSKGHIEAMTRRRIMKEILKDLWIESKALHEAKELIAA